jgi:hypothetical protein
MQVVLLGQERDSNYVDLVEFCSSRGIKLVEEKITSTNSDYAAALENIVLWALGEVGDFPMVDRKGPLYSWRKEMRVRLNVVKAQHCA